MRNQTILVVDDEFLIRFMVSDVLREAGYHVVEACDGDEGLTMLQSGQTIDLIVTDVRMPGAIDGMELTRRSKALDPSRRVIVCSGHLQPEESGPADAFLAKPYSVEALLQIAKLLLGKTPQPRLV